MTAGSPATGTQGARTPPSPGQTPSPAPAPRPVQRRTQPERLHPHRLARQHPHIMINHRDRLLVLRQIDPDHHAITRQQPPQPLPPRIPPPIAPRHAAAATLTRRTSSSLRLGHQARTTAPGGRSCISHIPARQRPQARCPITTPWVFVFHKPPLPRKRFPSAPSLCRSWWCIRQGLAVAWMGVSWCAGRLVIV